MDYRHAVVVIVFFTTCSAVSVTDYFQKIGRYFGYNSDNQVEVGSTYNNRIPYEVTTEDEKFIAEAAKLTGVALSELDSCQHRVVLKLQTDCHKLNDEQLAKLAVQLLNCQSYVEGRPMYPCTDAMSIKDCTTSMDSDTWTSYHLMSNRARAVCYSIRQAQFRGLAEHTVNRLMSTAQDQLSVLGKMAKEQKNIQELAEETLSAVEKGQQDFKAAQLHSQLTIEDNIRRLVDEKNLISESHEQLASLARSVQKKLENAAKEIEFQAGKTKFNHEELLDDLVALQNKAQIIYQRIEESTELLAKQNLIAQQQYEATLSQLADVNETVHNLVSLVDNTKQALEQKLAWLSTALGGTDLAVERLYLVLCHVAFLLVTMVCCAFLAAPMNVRLIVATVPPINLSLAVGGSSHALEPAKLVLVVAGLVAVQLILSSLTKLYGHKIPIASLPWKKQTPKKLSSPVSSSPEPYTEPTDYSTKGSISSTSLTEKKYAYRSPLDTLDETFELRRDNNFNDYGSPTPPLSTSGQYSRSRSRTPLQLNGSIKGPCQARTRLGTPCKLGTLPGRDFCYRHQMGDSVMET